MVQDLGNKKAVNLHCKVPLLKQEGITAMVYVTSPYAPRARREAINLVLKQGLSNAEAARRSGVSRSTIGKWLSKAKELELHHSAYVPTLSSAPLNSPNALPLEIVNAIVVERNSAGRCARVVHHELSIKDVIVSLSSVKRTIRRKGLTRPVSKWKRYRVPVPRPPVLTVGDLVQIDTIHFIRDDGSHFYVYTLIDLYSRAAYAEYSTVCNQRSSFCFAMRGQNYLGISFNTMQADNGPEFQKWFNDQLQAKGIILRHSRVRQCNDNAYIERFNRTLQDECLSSHPIEATVLQKLKLYLNYYNNERPHLGINCNTPGSLLPSS